MHPSPHSPKMPINCSKEPDEGHKKVTEHSVRRALSAAWWGLFGVDSDFGSLDRASLLDEPRGSGTTRT